jgi:tetratricopeptide (TPR) repeat protein
LFFPHEEPQSLKNANSALPRFQFSVPPTLILLFTLLAFPAALARDISSKGDSGPRADARGVAQTCCSWHVCDELIRRHHKTMSAPAAYLLVARVLLSLILLVGAGAFVRQTLHYAQAERDYKAAVDFERNGNLASAAQGYRQGLARDPLNGRLHFGLARALFSTDQPAEALAETLRAERAHRDSHIEVLKARILDPMGAARPALETYRHALALGPTLKTVQTDIKRLEESYQAQ